MALTTGKRQVQATASSVANRMGVVPAYGGDPVSTIAKVATEKLDFFAKRQATLEEAKYKADLDLTTSKFINDKSREFFDSPDSFTKATDEYLNTLVSEAPDRYKSWTKSMISGKALRKGEQIFNTRIKLDHIEATEAIKSRLNSLYPAIDRAKDETIAFYKEKPESFAVVKPTDLIMDYLNDIEKLLNQ